MNSRENIIAILAELWENVLELDELPKEDDDFFDLGGNSYKAFFIISNLPEEYQKKLEMNDFYEYETLSGIADRLLENIQEKIQ